MEEKEKEEGELEEEEGMENEEEEEWTGLTYLPTYLPNFEMGCP